MNFFEDSWSNFDYKKDLQKSYDWVKPTVLKPKKKNPTLTILLAKQVQDIFRAPLPSLLPKAVLYEEISNEISH